MPQKVHRNFIWKAIESQEIYQIFFALLLYNTVICVDISTFHFPTLQFFFQQISSSVPFLNFENSPLYTFWILKKVELVKNDFQKAQKVTHYHYWTLFLSKWKYILSWLISVNTNVVHSYTNLIVVTAYTKSAAVWTLFNSFFPNIFLTHVTKGLRI